MSRIGRHCALPDVTLAAAVLGRSRAIALACATALVAFAAAGQQNMGFEETDPDSAVPRAWSALGAAAGAAIALDPHEPAEGLQSLRIAPGASGNARVVQRVAAAALRSPPEARGRRLRLSGQARVAEGAAGVPALWLRVDGAKGPLFLDSQGAASESRAAAEALDSSDPAPNAWRRFSIELPWPEDVTEIAFGVSTRGGGTVWFDDLALEGVTAAPTAAASGALRYLDDALAVMREHSLLRASVDWPALRDAARAHLGGARTAADAHLAVRFALRELGDRHSYLQAPAVVRALEASAVGNALTRQPPRPPSGSRLSAGQVHLTVPGFAGGSHAQQGEFARNMQNVIQDNDIEGTCGWVVDLRDNRGGNLWPMLVGLGPLLPEGELAASVYPDGRRTTVWYRAGQGGFGDYVQLRVAEPYRLVAPAAVALLVGPGTASSAEVLAVAFQGQPGVRSFGAPTAGVSAGNRIFSLSDGAALVLTVAATSDRSGRIYADSIAPDEAVSGGAAGEDRVLDAARRWLASAAACH
jgi:carboxyl-terminal processing protease